MEKARIVNVEELRIDTDGPGVCTLVHTYGCNMRCRWCSNPNTWTGDKYNDMTTEELYLKVCNHNLYYQSTGGGITFSGGEPLLWTDYIVEFSQYCKTNNWKLNVETSCNIPRKQLSKTIGIVDNYFIDIKHMNSDIHREYTDIDNKEILDNIAYLSDKVGGDRIQISLPLIPDVNDSEENILSMCTYMNALGIMKVNVIPYRTTGLDRAKALGITSQVFKENSRDNIDRVKSIFNKNISYTI